MLEKKNIPSICSCAVSGIFLNIVHDGGEGGIIDFPDSGRRIKYNSVVPRIRLCVVFVIN